MPFGEHNWFVRWTPARTSVDDALRRCSAPRDSLGERLPLCGYGKQVPPLRVRDVLWMSVHKLVISTCWEDEVACPLCPCKQFLANSGFQVSGVFDVSVLPTIMIYDFIDRKFLICVRTEK
jgi:hypothetical protein